MFEVFHKAVHALELADDVDALHPHVALGLFFSETGIVSDWEILNSDQFNEPFYGYCENTSLIFFSKWEFHADIVFTKDEELPGVMEAE